MKTMLRRARRNLKNCLGGYTEIQVVTRQITSNDPAPIKLEELQLLADETYRPTKLTQIMYILWNRLFEKGPHHLHVEKSVILLHFLLTHGHPKISKLANEHKEMIQTLVFYTHRDHRGESGFLVREKADAILKLLDDRALLTSERQKYESFPERLRREAIDKHDVLRKLHGITEPMENEAKDNFELEGTPVGHLIDLDDVDECTTSSVTTAPVFSTNTVAETSRNQRNLLDFDAFFGTWGVESRVFNTNKYSKSPDCAV